MTISATTQGLRPGVCTSTSRPSAPFDGQVIYETDTNTLAVYDGSGWVSLNPVDRDRNVIINGAMQVHQRGTSVTGSTAGGYLTADRWNLQLTTLGTWTETVENDAPTGSGFRKSLKVLCTTADTSPVTNDVCIIEQLVEGQNLQQFLKGTASAKQFTLSFWVKSNVTGTYIARFNDFDNTRSVSSSYTISASGTWEKKTITFPADTTGPFDNNNELSLRVQFWLGAGSAFTSGTLATTWQSTTNANLAVGQVNLANATNNYWQVTGVQLEAGAVATPFEFEDYGTTLAKCQRYFQSYGGTGTYEFIGNGVCASSTLAYCGVDLITPMRAAPTISTAGYSNVNQFTLDAGNNNFRLTALSMNVATSQKVRLNCTVASGLTTTNHVSLLTYLTETGKLWLTSEL